MSKNDKQTYEKEERKLQKILTAVYPISNVRHLILDLMYRNLTNLLRKTKNEPDLGFEDFLKSDHDTPVFNKACTNDFQRHKSNLINNPIFYTKGLNLL